MRGNPSFNLAFVPYFGAEASRACPVAGDPSDHPPRGFFSMPLMNDGKETSENPFFNPAGGAMATK
jgi:hypothetical protein